uniref:Uncharacterized protein n=1 Tax=Anguilla anguilla TaxID=7936 RepID=A0A0E9ULT2_ANGAN
MLIMSFMLKLCVSWASPEFFIEKHTAGFSPDPSQIAMMKFSCFLKVL